VFCAKYNFMVTAGHSLCVVQTTSDLHSVAFLENMGVLHRKNV